MLSAILAAVALIVAIGAIPLVAPAPWPGFAHYECRPGATVATRQLWTPQVLLNAPYRGFANGTGSVTPGSARIVNASNGEAVGAFELAKWTVTTPVRVLVAGPGPNAACGGYVATPAFLGLYMGLVVLEPANSTSDVSQPHSLSVDGYDSVLFHNGYVSGDETLGTCLGGPVAAAVTASQVLVDVPFTLNGSREVAQGTITGSFGYTYVMPSGPGVWSVDDLNTGTNAPGGGLAFSYEHCP